MPSSWVFQTTKGDFENCLRTTPQKYLEQGAVLIDLNIERTVVRYLNHRDLWFNTSVGDRLFFYLRHDREFVGYGTIVEKFESDEPIPGRTSHERYRLVVKVERILPVDVWGKGRCKGILVSDYGPWSQQFYGIAPLKEEQIEAIISCMNNNGAVELLQAVKPAPKVASTQPQQAQQLTAPAPAPPATAPERQVAQQVTVAQAAPAEAHAQGGYTHKELVDMVKDFGTALGLKVATEYTLTKLRRAVGRERRVDVAFFIGDYDEDPIAIWEIRVGGDFEKDVNVFEEIRRGRAYKGAKLFYVVSSDDEYEDTVRYLNARGLGEYVIVVRPEDLRLALELVKNRAVRRILAELLEDPDVQDNAFKLWKSGSP